MPYQDEHQEVVQFRAYLRENLGVFFNSYSYTLTYDNELQDQNVWSNWVFKLIYTGKDVIEISNRDYRDYREYFHLYRNKEEIFVINVLKYKTPEEVFRVLKVEILKIL